MRDPDPRVLDRAREGDLGAFEELVRASQAEVYRFALHLTRERPMAEDVTQETYLRAFRFLSSFRGDCRFSSWLLRICRNCSMDALRARSQRAERDLLDPDPASVSGSAPVATGDAAARVELQTALDAVSEEHREPFLLIEVYGLSYRETADVLQVRVGTVKSRMHRARKAMCEALTLDEPDEGDTGAV
ncbi:MAG: sigma-70 family RNA polymerase sigma factor [Actinomycetota bacterium]